jgi:hypothetical protein
MKLTMNWRTLLAIDLAISTGCLVAFWLYANEVPDIVGADLLSYSAKWLAEFRFPDLR